MMGTVAVPEELRRLINEAVGRDLLAAGADYRDLAALGLWCPICGAWDDIRLHDCPPSTKELRGLQAVIDRS